MKVAAVQLNIEWENKQANYAKVANLLDRAQIQPNSLIVLPEMFSTGFSMNVSEICENESNETGRFLQNMARKHRSFVLGGMVEKQPDGRGRNEAAVVDPAGGEIARYAKMHPFSFAGETGHYAPGDGITLFHWNRFAVAPFICYDLRFPEIFRHAAQQGATLFAVIACWPQGREAHWMKLLQARAIENQAYVVGVNRCGRDPKLAYSGRSAIIDPKGNVLVDAGNDEGIISAELDWSALDAYRREFPALADIRPEYRWE
ncbi:MAG: carbon-nitrogen family hydrolase [Candidatus Omnitrophica bacterium]|nr:carbon-nitrogen family hydrolase [Candidatus Omnitrophota bacterium]